MLYGILRIIFFLFIYTLGLILIFKSKIIKKKFMIFLVSIIFVILCPLSFLIPIENLFINFKSPEAVFKYVGYGKIKDITCGKKSCMIISSKSEDSFAYLYSIVLKKSNGYKIGTTLSYRNILKKEAGNKYLEIYNVVNTKDYYVFGLFSSDDIKTRISDSENTKYKNVVLSSKEADYKTYINCAYVENIKDGFTITFDEEEIKVEK